MIPGGQNTVPDREGKKTKTAHCAYTDELIYHSMLPICRIRLIDTIPRISFIALFVHFRNTGTEDIPEYELHFQLTAVGDLEAIPNS